MPNLPYTLWKINGSEVALGNATRLFPVRLGIEYQGQHDFEFAEGPGAEPEPSIALNSLVYIEFDRTHTPVPAFRGRVVDSRPTSGQGGRTHSYRACGAPYLANLIPFKNPATGTNLYVFNAPPDDPNYAPSATGLTIGEIIQAILDDHEDALDEQDIGIAHLADFDVLNWTPPDAITISGERLYNTLQQFLNNWAQNYRFRFAYSATGAEIRLANLLSPTTNRTITFGVDEAEPVLPPFSIEAAASRVEIVGDAQIEPFELFLSRGELVEDWDSTAETAWTLEDFTVTESVRATGVVTSMTESAVVVDPDGPKAWAANFWSGTRRGRLRLRSTPITGVESQETRFVSSNGALTSGGTCTINVANPFTLDTHTEFDLYGMGTDTERTHVWRRYKPANADIAERIRRLFARDEIYRFAGGSAAISGIRVPMAHIYKDGNPYQMLIEIDQANGTIVFTQPVVTHQALGNATEDLNAGTVTTEPEDISVFIPVAVAPLSVCYPPNDGSTPVYAGKAFDWYGLQRTHTAFLPHWKDIDASQQIADMAEQLHSSMCDPQASFSVTLYGAQAHHWAAMDNSVTLAAKYAGSGSPAINLGHASDINFPVMGIVVDWSAQGLPRVILRMSNDRRPLASDAFYTHGIEGNSITNNYINFDSQEGVEFGGADLSALEAQTDWVSGTLNHGQFLTLPDPSPFFSFPPVAFGGGGNGPGSASGGLPWLPPPSDPVEQPIAPAAPAAPAPAPAAPANPAQPAQPPRKISPPGWENNPNGNAQGNGNGNNNGQGGLTPEQEQMMADMINDAINQLYGLNQGELPHDEL